MKMKMRPRYYCDHCGRGNGNPGYMKKHEVGCTNNPNRVCGICPKIEVTQKPMHELIEAIGSGTDKELDTLRDITENCPVCILAAIRQAKIQRGYDEGDEGFSVNFDFKAELKIFWEQYNEDQYDRYLPEVIGKLQEVINDLIAKEI